MEQRFHDLCKECGHSDVAECHSRRLVYVYVGPIDKPERTHPFVLARANDGTKYPRPSKGAK
jgi:hypothetical protein